MPHIKNVCVFCGSREGNDPAHRGFAAELGRLLGEEGFTTIYGGGQIGLMGIVADAALAAGGRVVGVIPHFLTEREVEHAGLTERVVTSDMHTRKAEMYARADAFVVLPGGTGTLDETVEVLSWTVLQLHAKPVILIDHFFWSPLIDLLERIRENGFAYGDLSASIALADDPGAAMALLRRAAAPA